MITMLQGGQKRKKTKQKTEVDVECGHGEAAVFPNGQRQVLFKKKKRGVTVMAQWKQIRRGILRLQV